MVDKEQEHILFLLLWLNKFIFPNPEGVIQQEYIHLAEALHNHEDVATCPFILASLYSCLHQITTRSMELNVSGPIWMIQIWLQWYFPELGLGDLEYPEDEIPALTIVNSLMKLMKTEECFCFFRDCKQREERQWLRSVLRGYPWFIRDKKIFELEAEEANSTSGVAADRAEKAISCLLGRDLLFGVTDSSDKHPYGVEAYNPQFLCRQFGLVQSIPELQYDSVNRGSSWRKTDLLPQDIVGIRTSWRAYIEGRSVPSYLPNPLQTNHFHEFWYARVDTWFPEAAKLFHSLVFNGCPFAQTMTGREELALFQVLKSIGSIFLTESSFGFRKASHQKSVLPKISRKECSSLKVPASEFSLGLVLGSPEVFLIIEQDLSEEEAPLVKKRRRSVIGGSFEGTSVMGQDEGAQEMKPDLPYFEPADAERREKMRRLVLPPDEVVIEEPAGVANPAKAMEAEVIVTLSNPEVNKTVAAFEEIVVVANPAESVGVEMIKTEESLPEMNETVATLEVLQTKETEILTLAEPVIIPVVDQESCLIIPQGTGPTADTSNLSGSTHREAKAISSMARRAFLQKYKSADEACKPIYAELDQLLIKLETQGFQVLQNLEALLRIKTMLQKISEIKPFLASPGRHLMLWLENILDKGLKL